MHHPPVPTPASTVKSWWASAAVYQIYPRSFADANGDGMGDLPGITARLPYLQRLGVDAVWLSPFYKSPQADGGYDVADYRQVDPLFGTLADFDAMLQTAHGLGLKVIVDLVPNHTSDEHAWFQEALAAPPGSPERDRYMFRPGKDEVPGSGDGNLAPNNWRSIFGGPAWSRVTEADGRPGDWYLHLFDTKQPDLNWDNDEVQEEMRSVMRFWLDRGVDGFRVDVAHGMVKEAGLPDWDGVAAMVEGTAEQAPDNRHTPPGDAPGAHTEAQEPHRAVSPQYPPSPFFDQDGVHDIYRDWNRVLAAYDGDRMMVAEAWVEPAERLARYVRKDEMQQAFNFDFLLAGWDAERMAEAIDASLRAAASVEAPSTWVLSNHDTVRHTTRFGLKDPTTFPKGIGAGDEQPDAAPGTGSGPVPPRWFLRAAGFRLPLPGRGTGTSRAHHASRTKPGRIPRSSAPGRGDRPRRLPRAASVEGRRAGLRFCRGVHRSAGTPDAGTGAIVPAAPWLPQPESFRDLAADRQDGVGGSTLELYRSALAFRSAHGLGSGILPVGGRPPAGSRACWRSTTATCWC